MQSQLAKTGKVPAAAAPPDSELHQVQPHAEDSETRERLRVIAATRASQRGVDSNEQMLLALLSGLPLNKADVVDILDLHAYAGDLGMATVRLRTAVAESSTTSSQWRACELASTRHML